MRRPTRPPALDRGSALFVDVDGTLLDIAPRPELVRVPADLPKLLGRLASEHDGAVALVSGRPIAQLDELFRPWHGAAAGLHGIERRRADGGMAEAADCAADRAATAALGRLRPELAGFANRSPGTWLEDKGRTLALHYREAPERGEETRRLAARLVQAESHSLRLIAGKMVVEFQPRHHGKHAAVAAFMAEPPFRGRLPVYLGDDMTDEDGFAEVNRRGGLSILVGRRSPTVARYAVASVKAARDWLAAVGGG